jgi:hypothetical protein
MVKLWPLMRRISARLWTKINATPHTLNIGKAKAGKLLQGDFAASAWNTFLIVDIAGPIHRANVHFIAGATSGILMKVSIRTHAGWERLNFV